MISVGVVRNIEGETTWQALRSLFRGAPVISVRAAISYVMQSGTAIVRTELSQLTASGAPVTVVFGDDFRLSQSSALRTLMATGCQLRLHSGETHPGFHPKVWIIDYDEGARGVVVGSSNLSRGGLITNAEANVVLHGTVAELAVFDDFWDDSVSESHEFGAADLESYIDSERTAAVSYRTPRATTTAHAAEQPVRDHIARWQRYIEHPHRIGQHERWRGWYLVPEHGQLTPAKLRELAALLRQIKARPQYRRESRIEFGTDRAGVRNAVSVVRSAGITTRHALTDRQRRDLFIRQQKFYLETFDFIRQVAPHTYQVTSAGQAVAQARTDRRRRALFTDALSRKKWPFGPIAYYPFVREVIERVPDRRLYYDDMSLIVIHSYHQAELQGIVNLVAAYRALPGDRRAAVAADADRRLRELLERYAGGSAYGRYRRKVADLMVAVGSTIGLRFVSADPEERSYIEHV